MNKPIKVILTASVLLFLSSCGRDEKQEAITNADLVVKDS